MLRETNPEIVHVCSPHHLHTEHSIAALELARQCKPFSSM